MSKSEIKDEFIGLLSEAFRSRMPRYRAFKYAINLMASKYDKSELELVLSQVESLMFSDSESSMLYEARKLPLGCISNEDIKNRTSSYEKETSPIS